MEIRHLAPGDVDDVLAAGHLFDHTPTAAWSAQFLARDGHHLLIAYDEGEPAGFVTGIEMTHPDKGTEVLLYELGVDEPFRRRGIARALVEALAALATDLRAYGLWVPLDPDNDAAIATYRSAGFTGPEETLIMTRELPPH